MAKSRVGRNQVGILFGQALIVVASGCDVGAPTITAKFEDVSITARLKNVKHSSRGDFVYATLIVTGIHKTLIMANLDCVTLHVGSSTSEEIVIDTLMDTLPNRFPAYDGKLYTPVIWDMRAFASKSEADFRDAQLVIDTTRLQPCFSFAPGA